MGTEGWCFWQLCRVANGVEYFQHGGTEGSRLVFAGWAGAGLGLQRQELSRDPTEKRRREVCRDSWQSKGHPRAPLDQMPSGPAAP